MHVPPLSHPFPPEDVLNVIHTLSHLVNVINTSAAKHGESLDKLRKDWKEQEAALVGRRKAIKGQEKSTARMLRTAKSQLDAARTRLELLVARARDPHPLRASHAPPLPPCSCPRISARRSWRG